MINQHDIELLRQGLKEEYYQEEQEEMRLPSDGEYSLEQLVDSELADMYDDLVKLANKVNGYGWSISVSELIDRLKDL